MYQKNVAEKKMHVDLLLIGEEDKSTMFLSKIILVLKDNRKQNAEGSYTSRCLKYVACSRGYKLVCLDA